jgi:plasmid stabilization system protein ParE
MIVFAEEAFVDLEQIFDFNYERDPATALAHTAAVRSAVLILETHPRIGRPTGAGSVLRELVISHGQSGYIALYEHAPAEDLVRIVAIRHQREAGYRGR